jgi:L-gulonolactone oxidase
VVGAGHSWSPIAVPDDIAVSLDRLDTGLVLQPASRTVTVSAGMRLHALTRALAGRGWTLPAIGSVQAQSVAGAIATGTHGSSLVHGNLATLATAITLVAGTGELRTFDRDHPDFSAVAVHLGALGVLTRVTLQVCPARRLRQTIEHLPVADVAAALPDLGASAEYVKVWWLPHAPAAQVVRYEPTDDPPSRPSATTRRWVDERVMHAFAFPALTSLARLRPSIVPPMNRRLSTRYLGPIVQVGADMLMLNTPMPMRHRETEAALPMTKASAAVAEVIDLFGDGRRAVSFPLEIRFVRGDDLLMSPAHGDDACQIGAYSIDNRDCAPYFDAFWRIMRSHQARPHWGKEFDHHAVELRTLYPGFDQFCRLRDQLDPQRVFGGRLHARILGD